jgi:septal ring factor EnvC (AmiA/AmiB activator)
MLDRAIDIELNYSVDHPRIERMRSLRKELRNDIERAQEQVPPARRAEARPAPARGSARSHADLHEEPFSDAPTAPADDDDPSCNAVSVGEDAAGYSKGLNPLPLSGSLAEKAPSSGRAEAAERVLRKVLTSILHHLRKRDV